MQLGNELKAIGVDAFPCVLVHDNNKDKWNKRPITPAIGGGKYEDWRDTAKRPIGDPAVRWDTSDCGCVGIPIPVGLVILDVDSYKPGCSTDNIDAMFGAKLPWTEALIQTTVSGGQHYAFRAPSWDVKQGSNIGGPGSGLDTRISDKGFICAGGEKYVPDPSGFGARRLAYPESLPVLPDACRPLLEKVAHVAPQQPAELSSSEDRDIDIIKAALAHIDPTERDTWRNTAFALKHYFHDDEATGYEIWDQWSAGEYWAGGCPAEYNPDTQAKDWDGFKAVRDGATITAGSMFHMAARAGWRPPARFDTSLAFGAGAAPTEAFNALVDRITERGTDSRETADIMQAITGSGFNEVQVLLLRNELKAAMKAAKLLDKDLAATIDRSTTPDTLRLDNRTDLARLNMTRTDALVNADGYALIRDGGRARIAYCTLDALGNPRFEVGKVAAFKEALESMPKHIDGMTNKAVPLGNAWYEASGIHDVFYGVTYRPDPARVIYQHNRRYLNTYTEPTAVPLQNDPLVLPFLQHLHAYLCSSNDVVYEWVLRWFAHIFQKPGEKPGTAVIFKGGIGMGKSKFMEAIGALLESNYVSVHGAGALTEDFNSSLSSRLLINADEAMERGKKKASRYRALVTSPTFNSTGKGKDTIVLPCYARVCGSTNEDAFTDTGDGERRTCMPDVLDDASVVGVENSEKRFAAMEPLYAAVSTPGFKEALLHHLRHVVDINVPSFDVKRPPTTKTHRATVSAGNVVAQWWDECKDTGKLYGSDIDLPEIEIDIKTLVVSLETYCTRRGKSMPSPKSRGHKLAKIGFNKPYEGAKKYQVPTFTQNAFGPEH